jgi:ABC-type sugar transport system substrate-binding protein
MKLRRVPFVLVLALLVLALSVPVLAQDEATPEATQPVIDDIVTQRSTDYLTNTDLAVPEGDPVDTSQYQEDAPWTIGFINWSTANSWTVQIVNEVQHEATLYPEIEEFIIVSSEGDANTQISQIEDMVARDVDAILLIPVAPDAIVPAVEEATAAGIPIVVFAAQVLRHLSASG